MTSMMLPPPGSRARVLRHLQHLEKPRKTKFLTQIPFFDAPYVHPKDRVPFWNIGPGDEVRVKVGGKQIKKEDGSIEKVPFEGIVDTIDRERSVVWLRAPEKGDESLIPRNLKHMEPRYADASKGLEGGFGPNAAYVARPVHYSNLQLKIPSDLKLPEDIKLDLKQGVYASRIARTKAFYDKSRGFFRWRRYAIVPTSEGTLKIEIPWKKVDSRDVPRKENNTLSHLVDRETWLPWAPSDPTWLIPRAPRTSPQALERYQKSLEQRTTDLIAKGADENGKISVARAAQAQLEAGKASPLPSMIPGVSTATLGLPMYPGFAKQLLSKPKMPITPQPPTPAEKVWMAKQSMKEWHEDGQLTPNSTSETKAENTKRYTFSAWDYLDVSPLEGPSSRSFNILESEKDVSTDSSDRPRGDAGRLSNSSQITKREMDNWPIELMMKEDLINEQGTKHRRLRWQRRQRENAEWQKVIAQEEKANLQAFKEMEL